jgi:hypothetical protein
MDYKEFEEIYQHLRFSFANWFALASPQLKIQINSILFFNGIPNPNLPLFEKRQRLLIILENEILSWLDSTIPLPTREPSLKRIDCRVSGESQCKDRCVWKGDTNKCLLHTPANFDVGSNQVPADKLLVRKLIEELVRFPTKRNELLKQDVGQYVKILAPFRTGNQYIIPEDLPSWSEMLRLSWTKKDDNKYIEDYSAISPLPEPEPAEQAPPPPPAPAPAPPPPLESIKTSEVPNITGIFGSTFYFVVYPSITQILNIFGISNDELEAIGQEIDEPITDDIIAEYISKNMNYSLYQLIFPSGNPIAQEPMIIKLQSPVNKQEISDFVVIVSLPDGRVGLVSFDTDSTPIPFNRFPVPVKNRIKKVPVTLPEA